MSKRDRAEAVGLGWGVLDGGATRTLGMVAANEAAMARNPQKKGEDGIASVDTTDSCTVERHSAYYPAQVAGK